MSMTPVDPVEPVAPYLGGKSRLAATICDRIDAIPHKTYAEPFIGMGGVFFRRRFRPRHMLTINHVAGLIIGILGIYTILSTFLDIFPNVGY